MANGFVGKGKKNTTADLLDPSCWRWEICTEKGKRGGGPTGADRHDILRILGWGRGGGGGDSTNLVVFIGTTTQLFRPGGGRHVDATPLT